jgi:hypothetical protein
MNANRNGSALAMTAPELPVSLKAAIDRAETAIAEQEQIEQALVVAREGLRSAEDDRREAQDRLAVAESAAAVGGDDVDRGARKRLLVARDEYEFVLTRIAGLEDRLRTATSASNEARRVLAVEYRAWTRSQGSTYIEQVYKPALEAILDAMRVLVAAGTALGVNRLLAIPRMAVVADPDAPERNLANRKRLAWQNDPASAALYERLVALRAVILPLLGDFADGGAIPKVDSDDGLAA